VLNLAQQDGGLPIPAKLKLNDASLISSPSPSEQQEIFHYKWFAEYGHADAARAVAHILTHGADQNLETAMEYLVNAAEMGDADAMAYLGHAYINGIAVEQDNATAKHWFTMAADRGVCCCRVTQ